MNPIISDHPVVPAEILAEDNSEMGGVQIESEDEEEVHIEKVIKEAPLQDSYVNIQDNTPQIYSEEKFNNKGVIREAPLHTADIRRISTSYKKNFGVQIYTDEEDISGGGLIREAPLDTTDISVPPERQKETIGIHPKWQPHWTWYPLEDCGEFCFAGKWFWRTLATARKSSGGPRSRSSSEIIEESEQISGVVDGQQYGRWEQTASGKRRWRRGIPGSSKPYRLIAWDK